MPAFEITAPDGKVYQVTAPEGATQEQVLEYAKNNYAAQSQQPETTETVSPINVPQQQRTTAEQLKRQLGLTGRYIAEAPSEFADFISTPIRSGLNLLLPEDKQIKTITEAVTNPLLKSVNAPVPETPLERIVGQATKTIIPVGGTARIAQAITPTSKVGQSIKTAFTESMPAQLASSALTGGGSQATAEAGGSPLAQTLVGLGLGVTPFLKKGAVPKQEIVSRKEVAPKEIKSSNDLLDKFEIETAVALKNGMPQEDAKLFAMRKLGADETKLNQSAINTNRNINTPKTAGEINALANYKKISEYKDPRFISKALEPITSRLKNISEEAANRLRRFEFNVHTNTQKYLDSVNPFMQVLKQLPKQESKQITLDLYNGNFANVRSTLNRINPSATAAFNQTENTLKQLYTELKNSGFEINQVDNYFPRGKPDLDGLYKQLGIKQKSQIEQLLDNKANKLNVNRADLSDDDVADTLNNYLRGYGNQSLQLGKPSFTKSRTIETINESILPYYKDPIDTLQGTIRTAVNNIEKRNFFGKNAAITEGRKLDIDKSIGNLIKENNPGEGLTGQMADEVKSILRARFNSGETAPSAGIQWAKDIIYLTTLTNPKSAVTQLGDLGMSAVVNGNANTIANILKTKAATVKDLGLEDVAAEMGTVRGTSKILNAALTISGFKRMDRLGKETLINSSLNKARSMAKSDTGIKALNNKYGTVFGNEFDSFVNDLKSGKITDNVKYYMFNELADVQPITLSELPRFYLENPNGRVLYALKSFTIKQLDVMKKRIYDEWKNGNKKTALKNATAYVTIMGTANTGADQIKKLMEGKEVRLEDIPDEFAFNVLKMFGGSEYLYNNYLSKGKFGEAIIETVAPPLDLITNVFEDAVKVLSSDDEIEIAKLKTTRQIPFAGWAIYNFFGGGLEKYEERKYKERLEK